MIKKMRASGAVLVASLSLGACGGGGNEAVDAAGAPDAGPPPVGNGIAAGYPGDVGIGSDSRVIFADDFAYKWYDNLVAATEYIGPMVPPWRITGGGPGGLWTGRSGSRWWR